MSASPVCYDDIGLGQELGSLVRGPLTTLRLMRWSAAIENWHRIHYDRSFAIERDHLPDLVVNGSLKQEYIVKLLKDWARNGWVWKTKLQFRAINIVGETLTVWGRVTEKSTMPRFGIVTVTIGIRNEAGLEFTPGSALVAFPFRGGPPIPYPFEPPTETS